MAPLGQLKRFMISKKKKKEATVTSNLLENTGVQQPSSLNPIIRENTTYYALQ